MISERWRLDVLGETFDFGAFESSYPLSKAPVISAPSRRTDDSDLPRTHGRGFGQDFFGGRSIDFELSALGDDYLHTLALVEQFEAAWNSTRLMGSGGTTATLRSPTGLLAFGRPRDFTADDDLIRAGAVSLIACSFETSDQNWYSSTREEYLSFAPRPMGGFAFPLVFPFSTVGDEGSGSRSIEVRGSQPSFPMLGIKGPITSPRVEIGSRFWEFPGVTVPEGLTMWIDTQPWSRSILLGGSPRVPSRGSTPLEMAGLEPGRHIIALRGISESATAGLTIRWRDAWARYKETSNG